VIVKMWLVLLPVLKVNPPGSKGVKICLNLVDLQGIKMPISPKTLDTESILAKNTLVPKVLINELFYCFAIFVCFL